MSKGLIDTIVDALCDCVATDERIGRRGENAGRQFLGCSNFPNCRFTTDL